MELLSVCRKNCSFFKGSFGESHSTLSNIYSKVQALFAKSSVADVSTMNNLETASISSKTIQPEIISDDWGKIKIRSGGLTLDFRDVVILPSSVEEWNWGWDQETMHHHPGVRIKDIQQLILSKIPLPDVIILTQGRGHGGKRENPGPGILEVDSDVRRYIQSQGVNELYVLKTAAAIEKYKEICSQGNKRIAALIHTTC